MILIMSEEFIDYLRSIPHRTRNAAIETVLFHRDAPVRNLYVVETGMVELVQPSSATRPTRFRRCQHHSVILDASVAVTGP
jgi:CRP-like cAMP-binding protein